MMLESHKDNVTVARALEKSFNSKSSMKHTQLKSLHLEYKLIKW
jgi:hypothetical protein